MTAKTTRIYVDLTDKQLADPRGYDLYDVLLQAIEAQRPRLIAVGDRVRFIADPRAQVWEVKAVIRTDAWLWQNGRPWGSSDVEHLARVDEVQR